MTFMQKANAWPMYLVVSIIIIFVMAMAILFLVKAYKRGVAIGMEKAKLRKVMISSASFTLIPSIGVLIGVIALAGSLGVPLPWLRLSVIGALHYETMAADIAAKSIGMPMLSAEYMDGSALVAITFVMTIGIIWGGLFCIFGLKKYQTKVVAKVSGGGENRWGNILFNAMFIGMVCAFIGAGFASLRQGSFAPLIVIASSALFMALFSWLSKKESLKWMDSFSLSFAMVLGMTVAVLLQQLGIQ